MNKIKVCICTSCGIDQEPRAPRHAKLISSMELVDEVIFVECVPSGHTSNARESLVNDKIKVISCEFPTRNSNLYILVFSKLAIAFFRLVYKHIGIIHPYAISFKTYLLLKKLSAIEANVYFGHNIETLLPIALAKQKSSCKVIFDSMELYSDMGDGQGPLEQSLVRNLERNLLKKCDLIIASSQQVSEALVSQYQINKPLAIYNKPPLQTLPPREKPKGLHLYWRNSTIALSQRGLGDILDALVFLPDDVFLHIQGKKSADYHSLIDKIEQLKLKDRVIIHDPFLPHQAVICANDYHVGICPEQDTCANQRLTVSNKLFDYMSAGLAVIASDLPGISSIVSDANAGLIFKSGDSVDLAHKIKMLYVDRNLLLEFSNNSVAYAREVGNEEYEMDKLRNAFTYLIQVS